MAVTLADCDAMIAACRDARVLLDVNHVTRHRASPVAAKRLIDDGSIGELRMVRVLSSVIAYLTDDHGWAHKAGEGGAWLDMGVHLFDALRWFTGSEVEVIFAKVRDFAGDPNQRRSGLAEVVMRNGVIVQVLISFEIPTPGLGSQSQWTFIGSDGIVESDSYGKVRLGRGRRLGGHLRDAAVRAQRRRLQPDPAEGVRGADAAVRARRPGRVRRRRIRRSTARTAGPRSRSSRRARDRRRAARRSTCRSTRPDPVAGGAPSWRSSSAGSSRRPSRARRGRSRRSRRSSSSPTAACWSRYSIGSGKDTDDLDIELRRSTDGGRTWTEPVTPFETTVDGRRGSLKAAPITRLDGDHLIVAALWIDREAFPGQPLFNPETEGCLPMTVLLADSHDAGRTWTPWRVVPMPDDIGPPSLTNAVLRLADGRLVLSIESNKPYLDTSKWFQRVVHLRSSDGGATWSEPVTVLEDPTGRIANWDQRGAIAPDGRLVTFTWTYDFETATYLNVRRRISADGVAPFGPAEDLGFADQPGHPAVLPDGRVVARLGRPVRDGEHPGAAGGRDRRALRGGDARSSSTGPATPSRAALGDRRRPTRTATSARPSSTWARGRTAWPSPRRCPTATSASSTTRRAPTAARTSAGRASGSTREPATPAQGRSSSTSPIATTPERSGRPEPRHPDVVRGTGCPATGRPSTEARPAPASISTLTMSSVGTRGAGPVANVGGREVGPLDLDPQAVGDDGLAHGRARQRRRPEASRPIGGRSGRRRPPSRAATADAACSSASAGASVRTSRSVPPPRSSSTNASSPTVPLAAQRNR